MPILVRRRRVDVKHGVVKVRVSVPSRTASQPLIALSRPQKRHVFDQVRQTLLILSLIHAPHVHLQVGLETPFWNLVRQDDVLEPVR